MSDIEHILATASFADAEARAKCESKLRAQAKRIAELEAHVLNVAEETGRLLKDCQAAEARLAAIDAYRGEVEKVAEELWDGQTWLTRAKVTLALLAAREQGAADEREACAKIARGFREKWSNAGGFGGHSAAARIIADNIRARKGTGHE